MSKTSTVKPTGYCMKEHATRDIKDAEAFVMVNGRKAVRGKCAICGCNITAISKVQ